MEAIIIYPSGIIVTTSFDPTATLAFLQGAVGGLVECLPFPIEGVDAWVNEEGKYAPHTNDEGETVQGLPYNTIATQEMRSAGLLFEGDWIAGAMVLTATNDEGDTVGLSEAQLAAAGF